MKDSTIKWNEDLTILPDYRKSVLIILETEGIKFRRILHYFFSFPVCLGNSSFSYAKNFKELELGLKRGYMGIHVNHYEKIIAWGYVPEIE